MTTLRLRTLTTADQAPLLAFEMANRAWFEQFVESRGDAFYTPDGVAKHIASYLDGYAQGTWYPGLLLNDTHEIVGRINLKDINAQAQSAELGYRLAVKQVGTGLATLAVAMAKDLAQHQLGLKQLFAVVAQSNAASNRVLEKSGFFLMPADARPTNWMGAPLLHYRCDLVDCSHRTIARNG